MSNNLALKYSTKLDERFKAKSFTEEFCGHNYEWDGVDTIKVWTIDQVQLHTYTKSGQHRFTSGSAPTDIGDTVATYTLSNNLSFATGIEAYDNADQMGIKKANSILKQIWDEQIVPEQDKFRLRNWASKAGQGAVGSSALTKGNIVEEMLKGQAALNNKLVGREGRVCFVTETLAVQTQLASELMYNRDFTNKSIVNGEITRMGGMPIVAIPDDYMPDGVQFMIKWHGASADPQKLKMLRTLNEVEGHYGPIMEGLVRFDSFVLANKANGIYVYGTASKTAKAPTFSISSNVVTMTSADSGTIKYTVDGSNPKTSSTAATYDSSNKPTITSDTLFRAYCTKTNYMDSAIADYAAVYSA